MRATWGVPTRNSVHFTFKRGTRNWFNYDGLKTIPYLDEKGQTQKMRFKLV